MVDELLVLREYFAELPKDRRTLTKLTAKAECRSMAVRPEGANHQWRRNPPRELSIDLVADERLGRVTGRAGAS